MKIATTKLLGKKHERIKRQKKPSQHHNMNFIKKIKYQNNDGMVYRKNFEMLNGVDVYDSKMFCFLIVDRKFVSLFLYIIK